MKKSEIVQRLEAIEKHIGIAKKYDEVVNGFWYWFEKNSRGHIQDALIFANDVTLSANGNYGLDHAGKWLDGKKSSYAVFNNLKIGRKATPQEVEEALVKEAEIRGFKGEFRIKEPISNDFTSEVSVFGYFSYNDGSDTLFYGGVIVYNKGKWAEIIEQPVDKFAELKEAHRNGKNIECRLRYSDCTWVEKTHVGFFHKFEYRIKPEEQPKVGDVFFVKIKSDKDIDNLLKFESYGSV